MVFVLDKRKKPLMPCTEKRVRLLLERGRAVVHRRSPFTIRLKDRVAEESGFQPLRLKLNPGAETSGIAVLREDAPGEAEAVLLLEVRHKPGIKQRLDDRRNLRRGRRHRKTRYRKPRFDNRRRPEGWLPPSLKTRANQAMGAVTKLTSLLPITSISYEQAKFDTQKLQNPETSGVEYQQGELFGYEVREYLLEKWGRRCAYCQAEGVPLEIEHIVPKARSGSDRVSNLTLACHECNQEKGTLTAEEFGHPEVQAQAKRPMKEEAVVNATRWKLFALLKGTGLPLECGTAARTKKQRLERGYPRTKYHEACCIGASTPERITIRQGYVSVWFAGGRGTRKMCRTDRYGFPKAHRGGKKFHFGFSNRGLGGGRNSPGQVRRPLGGPGGCKVKRLP